MYNGNNCGIVISSVGLYLLETMLQFICCIYAYDFSAYNIVFIISLPEIISSIPIIDQQSSVRKPIESKKQTRQRLAHHKLALCQFN